MTQLIQEGIVDIFMLLDRSGSMGVRWVEAVSAINGYIEEVRKAAGVDLLTDQDRVTLAAFDQFTNGLDFRVLRDGQPLKAWAPLGKSEVLPRGQTPLLDAVVRIAAIAEQKAGEKTVVVILSDGYENASREATKDMARTAIGRLQARAWQVVYLGADFDAFAQAQMLGIAPGQTMNTSRGHFGAALKSTAAHTTAYRMGGGGMSYSMDDRKAAGEDKIPETK